MKSTPTTSLYVPIADGSALPLQLQGGAVVEWGQSTRHWHWRYRVRYFLKALPPQPAENGFSRLSSELGKINVVRKRSFSRAHCLRLNLFTLEGCFYKNELFCSQVHQMVLCEESSVEGLPLVPSIVHTLKTLVTIDKQAHSSVLWHVIQKANAVSRLTGDWVNGRYRWISVNGIFLSDGSLHQV